MQDWIFGIDGGGTASRLRAESLNGTVLYRGSAGSTNLNSNSPESVEEQLRQLFENAYASGCVEKAGCVAGFLGSAGAGRPAEKSALARFIAGQVPETAKFRIGDDAEPALAGALGNVEGYILIAGTGSIALGRSVSGETCRAGGWGHWLGDEGSAFWIAFEAIKRGIRASEGREEATAITEEALLFFGKRGLQELIPCIYKNFDKPTIARFAVKVDELRIRGDRVAARIFDQAADALAKLVSSVYFRFNKKITNSRVALCGGLIEGNAFLRNLSAAAITRICPALPIADPVGDAQEGACLIARSMLA